jgi:RepB DNA-primase from phage plasmid
MTDDLSRPATAETQVFFDLMGVAPDELQCFETLLDRPDDKTRVSKEKSAAQAEGKRYRHPLGPLKDRQMYCTFRDAVSALWPANTNQKTPGGAFIAVATVEPIEGKWDDGSPRKIIRRAECVVGYDRIAVDLDRKDLNDADREAWLQDTLAKLAAQGVTPSATVRTSPGKAHLWWRLKERASFEKGLQATEFISWALGADPQAELPTQLLRLPGFTHNKGAPRRVLVDRPNSSGAVFELEGLSLGVQAATGKALEDHSNAGRASAKRGARAGPKKRTAKGLPLPESNRAAGLNDDLRAGLDNTSRPVNLERVAKECGFVAEALRTGGEHLSNSEWNSAMLLCTFTEGGLEDAKLFNVKPGDPHGWHTQSTEEVYAYKLHYREEKNLGWPLCATIERNGSAQCAACPHRARQIGEGLSPLHLGCDDRKVTEWLKANNARIFGPTDPKQIIGMAVRALDNLRIVGGSFAGDAALRVMEQLAGMGLPASTISAIADRYQCRPAAVQHILTHKGASR